MDKIIKMVAVAGLCCWIAVAIVSVYMRLINEISTIEMTINVIALMVFILLIRDKS